MRLKPPSRVLLAIVIVLFVAALVSLVNTPRHDYKQACAAVPPRIFAEVFDWHVTGKADQPEPYGTSATLCWFRAALSDGRSAQVFEQPDHSRSNYARNFNAVQDKRVVKGKGYSAFISTDVYRAPDITSESLFLHTDGEYVNVNLYGFPPDMVERLIPAIVANLN